MARGARCSLVDCMLGAMAVAAARPVPGDHAFFGHPIGLSTLFFTEMWERFSFYGMRALLVLFMTKTVAEGGLGFTTARSTNIYGNYMMFVYLTPIAGGLLADMFIGARRSVLIGGIIIATGHFCMLWSTMPTFYLGLFLIIV